ncbi:GtrA family protein [Mesorhizobium sp. LHD-90]|uniref:GtrA family protein n=1 Tax=Mesorhizobium sp. LHD-90 TaxID=3071414 RepID=UPI0027DF8E20|nr:GtrA family protein [Mesorhizobium sp. LHD-90]MDQ6434216.1 GtrA family protein [Mesorhizobium sp. LHD-90]
MHDATTLAVPRAARLEGWKADLAASLLAALVMVVTQAAGGFPTLFDSGGDNDSVMRLVQIRDWLGGQPWFDLHQYRMGPEGGFVMHWSRIVDAPVAAIMLAVAALTGSMATGEIVAAIVWPVLLSVAALFLLVRAARLLAGPDTVIPALVIGAITLNSGGLFTARSLDHHNLQLVFALATVTLLLAPGRRRAAGAGICAAIMLAIGMETAPYVAVAGLCAAATLLAPRDDGTAAGFGIGFAGASALALVTTVPPSEWWIAQCDAYSARLGVIAVLGGLGLTAVAAFTGSRGLPARLAGLLVLAVAVSAAAVLLAPSCFGDPYAGLDQRLRDFWLDAVTEAQPLWRVFERQPENVAQNYVTPLIAIGLLAMTVFKAGARRAELMLLGFLLAATAVSVWQIRGTNFSLPFAIIALAAMVAAARREARQGDGKAAVRMVLAWLVSLPLVWAAGSHTIADLVAPKQNTVARGAEKGRLTCTADATFARLAQEPATTVLAISNLGAPMIATTPHRVLAGPYHRNIAGNVATLDAFMGTAEEAHAVMRREKVGLLAFCPGNGETKSFVRWAPHGFMAELVAGNVPSWLEPIAETSGQPLLLYRVH